MGLEAEPRFGQGVDLVAQTLLGDASADQAGLGDGVEQRLGAILGGEQAGEACGFIEGHGVFPGRIRQSLAGMHS